MNCSIIFLSPNGRSGPSTFAKRDVASLRGSTNTLAFTCRTLHKLTRPRITAKDNAVRSNQVVLVLNVLHLLPDSARGLLRKKTNQAVLAGFRMIRGAF